MAPKEPSLSRHLITGASWSLAGTGFEYVAATVLAIVLGRALGPEAYGLLPLAMSIAEVPRTIALSGFGTSLVRTIAKVTDRDEVPRSMIRDGAILLLGFSTACAAGLWAFAGPIGALFHQPGLTPLMYPMALLVFAAGFVSLAMSVLNGYSRIRQLSQLQIFTSILRIVLAIALALGLGLGVLGAAWGNAAAFAIGAGIGIVALIRLWRAARPGGESYLMGILGYSGPLTANWFAVYGIGRVDMLIVGFFVHSTAQIAFFSIASAMVALPLVIIQSLNIAISPVATRLHSAGDEDRLTRLYAICQRAMLLLFLPITVIAFFGAAPVLRLLLPQYLPAAIFVQILSITFVPRALGSLASSGFLIPLGRASDVARYTYVAAAANIVLDLLLIPVFGALGSVMGTVVVQTIVGGVAVWRVRQRLDLRPLRASYFLRALAAAAAMALVVLAGTLGVAGFTGPWAEWIGIALGIVVFCVLTWVFGLMTRSDVGQLRAALGGRGKDADRG